MLRTLVIALAFLVTACATAQFPPRPDISALDAGARRAVEEVGFRGVAMLVDARGPVWQFTNGDSDCNGGRALTPADRYDMGSITKLFTATLILRMVERGELSLDDRLGDRLDGVPVDKAEITIREIMMHRAGFRDASGLDEDWLSRDDMLRQELAQPLLFAPGSQEEYSNVGYSILAAIVERRTGERFEPVLRRILLRPAGIDSVGYVEQFRQGVDVCGLRDGARYGSVRDYFHADEPSWNLTGNGALLATPEDLARFFRALIEGRILDAEHTVFVRQEALTRNRLGRSVLYFSGSNEIFTSIVMQLPDHDMTFVLMTSDSRAQKETVMPFLNPAITDLIARLDEAE